MIFVYVLRSKTNTNKIYIGQSVDIERRLAEHNRSEKGYSKRYAPWELVAFIAFLDGRLATNFESYLKSGSGFAFMKKRLVPALGNLLRE